MKSLILFLLPLLFLAGCDENTLPDNEFESTALPLKAGMQEKVQQDNAFSFQLFKQVLENADESNVFISPLSVSIALGMAWNGADAETKAQIAAVLGFDGVTGQEINEYYQIMQRGLPKVDNKTNLNIANSIWYREGFPIHQDFLDVNSEYFDAEVQALDFSQASALKTINDWCALKTHNLIKEPLDGISADAMLYLINAIYFKGIWTKKFDPDDTRERSFTAEDGMGVTVNMMSLTDTFAYYADEMAQYVTLPYGNESYNMTVILPAYQKGIAPVLADLDAESWNALQARMVTRKVKVDLPRFKTQNKFELKDPLMAMGMVDAFSANADFSRISDIALFISRVIHSTFCEVNEEGTEAAAVTIIEFEYTSTEPSFPVMTVDRPFLFVIHEKQSGSILFMGKMGKVEKY